MARQRLNGVQKVVENPKEKAEEIRRALSQRPEDLVLLEVTKEFGNHAIGEKYLTPLRDAKKSLACGTAKVVTDEEERRRFIDDLEKQEAEEKQQIADVKANPAIDGVRLYALECLAKGERDEATEAIVDYIKQTEHIKTLRDDTVRECWAYKDGIYQPNGKTLIDEIVRNILGRTYTTNLSSRITSKIEADTFTDKDEFFRQNTTEDIVIVTGIFNLTTRTQRPHTPDEIHITKLPLSYDPQATCPTIQKHFGTVLKSPDDIHVIQEQFGYLLSNDARYEVAFMYCGTGRNGKSKTLSLMREFVGPENVSGLPLQQLDGDVFALGELVGKKANIAGDLSSKAVKESGGFKTLVGRDAISAARKFLSRITFVNTAKLFFSANELPRTHDVSPAFFARWSILDFPYTFVSEEEYNSLDDDAKKNHRIKDDSILDKLVLEKNGLLNWALDGLERLRKNKRFTDSRTTEEIKRMWIRRSDSFSAFIMDCVTEDYDGVVPKVELRRAYGDYCRTHKLRPVSDRQVKTVLADMGVAESQDMVDGKRIRVWEGITIQMHGVHRMNTIFDSMGKNGMEYMTQKPCEPCAPCSKPPIQTPLSTLLDALKTSSSGLSLTELRDSCIAAGLSAEEFAKVYEEAKTKGIVYCPRGEGPDKPVMLTEGGG